MRNRLTASAFHRMATAAFLTFSLLISPASAAPPAGILIYVDHSATGNHTGTSWPDAYTDLHAALSEAATIASPTTPVEIWVAEGLYHPDHGTGDRLGMYQVPAYTELYGGFAGTEVVRTQRDWHAHHTILDGDLLGNDDPDFVRTSDCCLEHHGTGCADTACTAKVGALDEDCIDPFRDFWSSECVGYAMQQCCDICRPSRCDNTYRIIDVLDGDGVVIDGFTIQNGEASNYQIVGPLDPGAPTGGAGLFVKDGGIVVRNIVFLRNAASGSSAALLRKGIAVIEFCTITDNFPFGGFGSAMGVSSFSGTSIVRDCVFSDNRGSSLSTGDGVEIRRCLFTGAGDYINAVTTSGTSVIADCWFIGNYTGDFPTVYISDFSAIVNSYFIGNVGEQGGVTLLASNAYVVDCAFIGNVNATGNFITSLGGPFSSGTVVNSLFVGNRVASGGALAGKLQIYNSIFWGNRDDDPSTPIQHEQIKPSSGPQIIDYSIVEGWDGSLGGVGNSGLDPLFVDPLGPDMLPATGDENYRLSFDSPAIDAGHPNPPLLAVRDLDGHRRTLCGATDLGPYEFGIADPDCDGDTDLADYFALPACLAGPTPIALPTSCHPFDFDADDAVDLSDLAEFQNTFQAP